MNAPVIPVPATPAVAPPEPPSNGASWMDLDPSVIPNIQDLVTEDDTPVDGPFTEKQERLLTEPLYSSWGGPGEGRPFLVVANVGLFYRWREPPVVPDCMLGLDVKLEGDLKRKENQSWFTWELGKAPDVVIEIISDRRGGELDEKLRLYERLRVGYYAVLDPRQVYGTELLRVFGLHGSRYQPVDPAWFPEIGLGLILWKGTYANWEDTWLRWCDREGRVIPTGAESAEEERRLVDEQRCRADEQRRRADEERRRADDATAKLQRLTEQLRALGVNPEL